MRILASLPAHIPLLDGGMVAVGAQVTLPSRTHRSTAFNAVIFGLICLFMCSDIFLSAARGAAGKTAAKRSGGEGGGGRGTADEGRAAGGLWGLRVGHQYCQC